MIVRNAAIAVLVLVAGAANAAFAADADTEATWRAACKHDALAHCTLSALAGDRAHVKACLLRNLDKISEPCRDVIRIARAQEALGSSPQPH